MNKKCFLVDDEILAIKELETMLKVFPELEIVGSSDRAAKAVEMINSLKPDLIFLDINMPGMSGLQLASQVRARTPALVGLRRRSAMTRPPRRTESSRLGRG